MRSIIISSAILVVLCNSGFSQPSLHFNYLTVEHGLHSNTVGAIYQDHMGFMWIGSWSEGITRYDGYDFRTYEHLPDNPNTLSNNTVSVIYEDTNLNLWIGTWNGANLYNREQEIFTRFLTSANSTLNIFHTIYEDSKGRIWIGGNELYQFQPKDSSFQVFHRSGNTAESMGTGEVRKILEDSQNQLWAATDSGLNLYDDGLDQFIHYPAPKEISGSIKTVCIDHLGRFWISTRNVGIWQFNPETFSYHNFYQQASFYGEYNEFIVITSDIIQDTHQNIWATTDGSGLLLLDPERNNIYVYNSDQMLNGALSDNSLISIYSDRQSNLWLGSNNTGICVSMIDQAYLKRYYHNPSNPNSLSSNLVTGASQDQQGDLWVTTDGGGVNRLELDRFGTIISNTIIRSENSLLPTDKIYGLMQDHEGRMWFNAWGESIKSVKFNPESGKMVQYEGALLFQDSSGDFWFWEEHGLGHYISGTAESVTYTLSLRYPRMLEDSKGDLWISDLAEGLNLLNKDSGTVVSKIPGMVTGICEGRNGTLWLTTMEDGLIRYEPETNMVTKFDRNKGFLTDDCRGGLLKDRDGFIWIGSNEGIIRFNPETHEMINLGLLNENLKYFTKPLAQTSDGKIYLGSSRGMIAFEPDKIKNPSIPPQPLFTSFQLFDRDLPVGENSVLQSNILKTNEITLTYKQNVFTIEFASLSFKPAQTVYSYKLEGYDEHWREGSNRRSATYTNLDAGMYQFKVRAGNLNGDWNTEEATIQITVFPPPWKTWWAYSMYVVAASCLLLLWRRQLLHRERMKAKLQLEHLELEKVKEMDQLKTRFFTNISHEFRTPLTLILGPLKQMYEGSFQGDAQAVIAVMIRNSKRLLSLINQLLDFSKLDAGGVSLQASQQDLVKFARTIFSAFESTARTNRIHYTFQSNRETISCYFDADLMEKVLVNLLSNAFKFTDEERSIAVKLSDAHSDEIIDQGSGVVEVMVEDTGQGIPDDKIPFVFDRFYQGDLTDTRTQEGSGIGLALVKELVELHYGAIQVESESGIGTRFVVRLPLGNLHLAAEELVIRENYPIVEANILEPRYDDMSNGTDQNSSQDHLPLVLIIEDNRDMRLYLKEILVEEYQLKEAENGSTGLAIAFEHIPDLIISDVMMPEMNGYELCRKLKTDERTSHIPVVLLTARVGDEARIKGLETGADDYITKPFSPLELKVRVQNLIDIRKKLTEKFNKELSINPKVGTVNSLDQRFIQKVVEILEAHRADSNYSVEAFAREIGMSRSQLHRKLKALTGHTATEIIRNYRLKYARTLLEHDYDNIAQIAYECGFKNPSYFTECFKKQFGVLPSEFARANSE